MSTIHLVVNGTAIAFFLYAATDLTPLRFRWWVAMLSLTVITVGLSTNGY